MRSVLVFVGAVVSCLLVACGDGDSPPPGSQEQQQTGNSQATTFGAPLPATSGAAAASGSGTDDGTPAEDGQSADDASPTEDQPAPPQDAGLPVPDEVILPR